MIQVIPFKESLLAVAKTRQNIGYEESRRGSAAWCGAEAQPWWAAYLAATGHPGGHCRTHLGRQRQMENITLVEVEDQIVWGKAVTQR